MTAQDLPYHQITDYPKDHGPGSIMARMIDGLGFRYYWATKDLSASDLAFSPAEGARNLRATLEHIYAMSFAFKNAATDVANGPNPDTAHLSYADLRKQSLLNFKEASNLFNGKTAAAMEKLSVAFDRNGQVSKVPLWHLINGQIADCIYHTGQITLMRRMNGNPINPKISVFMGTVRE